jgi:hypothetical protein
MNTSTRITASIIDALNSNPLGFTLDVNTGEVVTHGMAVGGYHQEAVRNGYAYPVNEHWLQWDNDGASFSVPFETLQEAVEEWLPAIQTAGFIGGWVVTGTLTLDIVQVYPCISHTEGIADATPFLEASRLDQQAIGWLCSQFKDGYKEVGVNF